jgi:hypothetical protein
MYAAAHAPATQVQILQQQLAMTHGNPLIALQEAAELLAVRLHVDLVA